MSIILFQTPRPFPEETVYFDRSKVLFIRITNNSYQSILFDKLSPRDIQSNEPLDGLIDYLDIINPKLIVLDGTLVSKYETIYFRDTLLALDPKFIEFESLAKVWEEELKGKQIKEVQKQYPSLVKNASNTPIIQMAVLVFSRLKRKLQPIIVR